MTLDSWDEGQARKVVCGIPCIGPSGWHSNCKRMCDHMEALQGNGLQDGTLQSISCNERRRVSLPLIQSPLIFGTLANYVGSKINQSQPPQYLLFIERSFALPR